MEEFTALIAWAAQALAAWRQANPILAEGVSFACRLLAPMLTLLILVRTIRSLLTVPAQPEVWAVLGLPNGVKVPLTRWENIMGRSPSADVVVNYPSVSRQHAAIIRRGDDADWTVYDLGSKMGTSVNGQPVEGSAPVTVGDTVELGGVPMVLIPVDDKELSEQVARRRRQVPISPWLPLIALTALQVLCGFQLFMAGGAEASPNIVLSFLALPVMMWLYFLLMRATGRVGFEMEIIAFFLSTLSLAVTASSAPSSLPKQMIALILGLGLFLVLGLLLRDLKRVQKLRWLMAAGCIGLLAITLVLGTSQFGATNWIRLGPLSFQPSEIAKICYVFAGAATLERLFRKRNLGLFLVLTGVCLLCLAGMSDFGTAAIFFVTFLVIAFLRSGDWATVSHLRWSGIRGVHDRSDAPLHPLPLLHLASRLGERLLRRLPAGAHHVRRRLRRAHWRGAGRGLASPYRGGGHRPGVRHALRRVGPHRGGTGGSVHPHPGGLCRPRLPGGPLSLLHHRRLRRRFPAGVPDGAERAGLGGSAPSDGSDVSLCVQRRLGHDGLLGPAGLFEGHRHPA